MSSAPEELVLLRMRVSLASAKQNYELTRLAADDAATREAKAHAVYEEARKEYMIEADRIERSKKKVSK